MKRVLQLAQARMSFRNEDTVQRGSIWRKDETKRVVPFYPSLTTSDMCKYMSEGTKQNIPGIVVL